MIRMACVGVMVKFSFLYMIALLIGSGFKNGRSLQMFISDGSFSMESLFLFFFFLFFFFYSAS